MIGSMEMSGGDLVSAADGKTDSLPEMKASDDQPWGHKVLFLSIVGTVLNERGVKFNFGPEFTEHAILEGVVP